jgi:hypothetical protein
MAALGSFCMRSPFMMGFPRWVKISLSLQIRMLEWMMLYAYYESVQILIIFF